MTHTSSLYETCHELFVAYPLATSAVNRSGTVRSMVLMLEGGEDAGFFVLVRNCRASTPSYSLWAWPRGDIIDIDAADSHVVPDVAVNVVTRGVPIPRDGSLFGWVREGTITALVAVYAEYTPASPQPGWAVMPLAGTPEAWWPPFTGECLFGHWSWERYRAGSIVSLADTIADKPETVFWADTKAIIGSDCCVVAHDITGPKGHTLRRGCYVYFQALREGKPVPSLSALLAEDSAIDLAPRFRDSGLGDSWEGDISSGRR